jgi:catechol 2,3-dioxygenase-like lactoylglutathione lyase family enzyme
MSTPQLDLIGIVEDMARSLALLSSARAGCAGRRRYAAPCRGHSGRWRPGRLDTLETIQSFDPGFQKPEGSGIGLAFRLDTPADVDATYRELVALGYHGHKAPWDAFWGQRYALIHDPDGYHVDLFAPLPNEGR